MNLKKCVVVSDSFKGTLSSREICQIARETIPRWFPGCEVAAIPVADGGAGAAGGMGAGCAAFLDGEIRPGVDAVLDLADFDSALDGADLVITGEGRVDGQSAQGKLISGVAGRTRARELPLIVLAGCVDDSAAMLYDLGVTAMFPTNRAGLPFPRLADRAAADYRAALEDVLRLVAAMTGRRIGHE